MNRYRYRALDAQGKVIRGWMDAAHEEDLAQRLRADGLELLRHRRTLFGFAAGGQVRRRELISFCFHMRQGCHVGLGLLEILRDLHDSDSSPGMRRICGTLASRIEGGSTLSEALREFPNVFSEVFVNLVVAGEQSGDIEYVFRELGNSLKYAEEQAMQIHRLLMYPAFLLLTVLAVVAFLMLYLVPELVRFVSAMGQPLPWHTRLLIGCADLVAKHWLSFLAAGLLAPAVFLWALRSSAALRFRIDGCLLRLPGIGVLITKIILARVSLFFSMLYSAGLTIPECLSSSAGIAGNRRMRLELERTREQVTDGLTLSESFGQSACFPPMFVRFVQVGENTGTLSEALRNTHDFYHRDVRDSVERMQSVIEPSMTILLGAFVAWVMFSVLGPIYDLLAKIRL